MVRKRTVVCNLQTTVLQVRLVLMWSMVRKWLAQIWASQCRTRLIQWAYSDLMSAWFYLNSVAGRGEDWLADAVRFHARWVFGRYHGQIHHLPVRPVTQADAAPGLPGSTYRLRTGEKWGRCCLLNATPPDLVATNIIYYTINCILYKYTLYVCWTRVTVASSSM